MSKGPRCDDINYLVSPGDTFKLFMDRNRFKEMVRSGDESDHLLPTGGVDVIPAFTLLEMTIASKNSDAANDKQSNVSP
jgi:hypothetical protein